MKNIRGYWFGIAVSLLLAGLVAFLGVVAVSSDNLGWGMAALLSYGVLFGGPLALVLALTWIVYMVRGRGHVPGRVHALLFLPTLLALLIVPVGDAIEQGRRDRFSEAHPAIAETHVNLSGDTIWLDMRQASTSMGASPYLEPASAGNRAFSSFRRYPGPSSGAAFPYEGSRLKQTVERYQYADADGKRAASLPLRRLPYPQLDKLLPAYGYGEAGLLVYQYYHYADHVEVAPTLARFSGMTEDRMAAARIPGLAIVGMENYTPETIARVEINGLAYDMGPYAAGSLLSQPCDPGRGGSPVLLDLEQPLRVRWQTQEAPQAWREAAVSVPVFGAAGRNDPDGGLTRVLLYFLPDGAVAAERYKEIRAGGKDLAIRATGMPAAVQPYSACGGAYAGYNPQTVRLLTN